MLVCSSVAALGSLRASEIFKARTGHQDYLCLPLLIKVFFLTLTLCPLPSALITVHLGRG